jgi:hypothetical protein
VRLGEHLEPIAEAAGDATPALSAADVATISIAVSLKRIADNLPGLDFSMIDNWAQTIAWNAGRSFEAGRRQ